MDDLLKILPFLIPILIMDFALAITAAIHVLRHPHYRFGNKIMWLVIVIAVLPFGPIIYFIFGKEEDA